ncbi:MAG: NAD(P)H nitroreductase [Elusimicrobia bacterium RIFOXYB2_FULL_49_7]|nr:MAG: NAD(P)H nitroreductase [Elusimicrobia bacterium RIFOXYB2_FULL_49_7]
MLLIVTVTSVSAEAQQKENDTMKTILSRKSVRNYTGKQLSKKQFDDLIRAGMAAPTAADKRPWAFIAITSKETLLKLSETLVYGKMLKGAGGAIVVCGVPQKSFSGVEQGYWIQDCSAATENILLAAESMGLGAVWLGIYPVPERVEALRSALGIPKDIIPLNVISIGYPIGIEKPKNKYDPENIHWERW